MFFPPSTASPAVQVARVARLATSFILNELYAGITETNLSPFHSHHVNRQDQTPEEHQAPTPALQQSCSTPSDRGTKDHSQALSDGHPRPSAPTTLCSQMASPPDDTSGLQSIL